MAMKKSHQKLLNEFHFEDCGQLVNFLKKDEFDGSRVIYAITDPEKLEVVYVGDTEQGRDVRGRLKAHLKDREKVEKVENESHVFIHVMVTEFMVLDAFDNDTGGLPALNKRKSQKHV